MTGPTGWPLPDAARLEPPPGDPAALAHLAARVDAAAAVLGDLAGQLCVAPAAACGWVGDDAAAADAQVARVGALARDSADALRSAAARVRRHEELLTDVRRRLAQLERAQAEDFDAAVRRMGAGADPATGLPGPWAAAAVDDLIAAEAARSRLCTTLLTEVEADAAATAAVLTRCSSVAGSDGADGVRHLEDLLPGWHAAALRQRGADFAAAFGAGEDLVDREQAARALLPWAGNGAVAAAVLTGLGVDGVQEALRLLGNGSLSSASALAQVMAAVLGAPVPTGAAGEVAGVRDVRYVDPDDVRTLDADHVALGMGVVLAAGRRSGRPGPPPATVREWGRQIVARERALGEPIRVHVRPSPALPGDPLEEILGRLARADAGPEAAGLLRAEPTWTTLLARAWDDGGTAFAAAVERAAAEPGDVVVRSGLRALAIGLGDDGDPAGWTVDRVTAASIAPALAEAVAARPDVVTEPLARAAAGAGEDDRVVLRGIGHLSTDPDAAVVLDGVLDEASAAPAVRVGWLAVREYGQRLDHALHEFAAEEQAEQREQQTALISEVVSHSPRGGDQLAALVSVLSVVRDADGTWEASADGGQHFPVGVAVCRTGGVPGSATAYEEVAGLLGGPTAPTSPSIDWVGLAADLLPGERVRAVVEAGVGLVEELTTPGDADTD